MLTFIEGVPLATLPVRPPGLLRELGELLGRIDRILAELEAGPVDRFIEWDIARIGEMPDLARFVEPDDRRRRVEAILATYVTARESRLAGVRRSLIHNDANDHNVIVTRTDAATARISGLIDFGDLVLSDVVVELAVAMAYCGLGASDPWQAALPVLEGFVTEHPLSEDELEMVFPAFCARLALSVSMSSRQRALGEAEEYALISEKPAWEAVEWIAACDADRAGAMAHQAAAESADR
jgi:Ser/Thr protein kinase RdoA (MazF antagonist)